MIVNLQQADISEYTTVIPIPCTKGEQIYIAVNKSSNLTILI